MSDELEEYFDVLGKPVCRRILRFLGERERASFKELKEGLGISVGALYYNLKLMRSLVAQDEDKRYFLTEKGHEALKLLTGASHVSEAEETPLPGPGLLERFFSSLYARPMPSLPLALAILAIGAYLSAISGLTPIVLFFSSGLRYGPITSAAMFIGGYAILLSSSYAISSILTRSRKGLLPLSLGSAISMCPSALFPLFWMALASGRSDAPTWALTAIMLSLAGASLVLLSHAIAMAKEIGMDKAALCALFVFYINVFLALILTWH